MREMFVLIGCVRQGLTHFRRGSNKFAIPPDSLYSARTSKQPRLHEFELHLSLTPSISASFSE